jgi:hypothetical protein
VVECVVGCWGTVPTAAPNDRAVTPAYFGVVSTIGVKLHFENPHTQLNFKVTIHEKPPVIQLHCMAE